MRAFLERPMIYWSLGDLLPVMGIAVIVYGIFLVFGRKK